MSFFQLLCPKDNLVDHLRETFNATPLVTPDAETQPLKIIAHRGKETVLWGPLEDLFAGTGQRIDLTPEQADVANVDIKKTASFNTKFGFQLLEGLLGGFNVSIKPLQVALEDVHEISLSFENVRKKSLAVTTLGRTLKDKRIDLTNPAMDIFTRPERPFGMYLISSVLESNKFSINIEKSLHDKFDVQAPVLEKLSDAGLNLAENKEHKKAIFFQGQNPLTFAFSAIELFLDRSGRLTFGEMKILSKAAADSPGTIEKVEVPAETSFIEPDAPALLSWNRRESMLP
jgi:hypothetical protein